MKRKRAPGGGRKAKAGPTSSLTFRIPDDLRRQLESEAIDGATVSERLPWHLRRSFNRQSEEERDPALRALLFMIARLAEGISPGELTTDMALKAQIQSKWRTELFNFRAFKVAVKRLLDILEEPPAKKNYYKRAEIIRRKAPKTLGPEFAEMFAEIHKTPESYGAWVFGNLWARFVKSDLPFTESEHRMMQRYPILGRVMEREYHSFQKARKALELKQEEDVIGAVKRIMKDRNLSGNDLVPPDFEEAIKWIADDAIKLLRSGPPPTLNEVLKLLKSEKRKDKRR